MRWCTSSGQRATRAHGARKASPTTGAAIHGRAYGHLHVRRVPCALGGAWNWARRARRGSSAMILVGGCAKEWPAVVLWHAAPHLRRLQSDASRLEAHLAPTIPLLRIGACCLRWQCCRSFRPRGRARATLAGMGTRWVTRRGLSAELVQVAAGGASRRGPRAQLARLRSSVYSAPDVRRDSRSGSPVKLLFCSLHRQFRHRIVSGSFSNSMLYSCI